MCKRGGICPLFLALKLWGSGVGAPCPRQPAEEAAMPTYYERNKERILAQAKAKYAEDPEKFCARSRAYQKTEKGKQTRRRKDRKLRTTPGSAQKKYKARRAVRDRVRHGTWPKVNVFLCAHCSHQAEHYHHINYDHPLWVVPLCEPCHVAVHA